MPLPPEQVGPPTDARESSARPQEPEASPRLLAVISDEDVSRLVSSRMGKAGWEVISARSAAEAWRVLRDDAVELIVMDLVLPDTDGRKFLMRLRERPDTSRVPVLILSGRDDSAIKTECFGLGANGFFGKPVDPDALVAFVEDLAQKRQSVELQEAGTGPLTGHRNRAGFLEAISALAVESPVALVLLELDAFEELNELVGWGEAEKAIIGIGSVLGEGTAESAVLARWEGAEFILLLPGANLDAARAVGEGLLAHVRDRVVALASGERFLTASAGVACGPAHALLEGLLETARYRLFRARAGGGDRLEWKPSGGGTDEKRVVVADDDPSIGLMLRARLEREGFRLSVHENGDDAQRAIWESPPDLVLLDVRMPGMDGFELLASIKGSPEHRDVPVIMITALGREADLVRGFELGADDYMVKPFSPTELLARIHRLLSRKRLRN